MRKKTRKRLGALALAAVLSIGMVLPVSAAGLPSTYDETYYATLDYYGAPTDASVVKSYRLNGQTTVTDFGVYDSVVNLTDSASPVISDGKVVFTPEAGNGTFYFEGKTTQPFNDLPWTISVSYQLNGSPILAEDLAGRTGLVEIDLDVLPNPKSPAYLRDNLVLTAATAFNDDDITSLEAPGAEVQLIGNLRAVLFMVLPGEEQHFAIRVGSDSFESSGLIFLAVPATLQQLEQVADLKEAKEDAEDSLDAIDASMDVILDTLEGMSGSLNAAADGMDRLNTARGTLSARKDDIYAAGDGLDALNAARATISAGKDAVSDSVDAALADLPILTASLAALDRYSQVSSQAIDDSVSTLNELNAAVQDLSPTLEATRTLVGKLQSDVKKLSELLTDVESYNERATDISSSMADILDDLDISLFNLRLDLNRLDAALRGTKGISPLSTADILGMLPEDQRAQMREVLSLHSQYEEYLSGSGLTERQLSFEDFIVAGAYQQFCEKTVKDAVEANAPAAVEQAVLDFAAANGREPSAEELAAIQAQVVDGVTAAAEAQLPTLEQFTQAPAAQTYIQQAKDASDAYDQFTAQAPMVETVNKKIDEVNSLITSLTLPTANVVSKLSDLCKDIGDIGLSDDLASMMKLCEDLLKTMKKYEGVGAEALGHMNELGDLALDLTHTADAVLVQTDALTALLNTYTPDVQSAITDIAALSAALQSTLTDTTAALTQARDLLDAAGSDLDVGAEKTLTGLSSAMDAMQAADGNLDQGMNETLSSVSAALRKATSGLDQTGTIRGAKDTIQDLMDTKWDEHSGQVDGLLNMDAAAIPVSMTDPRNGAPRNVQYIMRTQEIKVEEASPAAEPSAEEAGPTTFWGRVAAMFRDLWRGLLSLLHIG